LRKIVLASTGQDLRKCRGCLACDLHLPDNTDVSFGSMVQLILINDDELLDSQMLWDAHVLNSSIRACNKEIDLQKVILALRQEKFERVAGEFLNE
jgi:heterodisulfide reductase subunit C